MIHDNSKSFIFLQHLQPSSICTFLKSVLKPFQLSVAAPIDLLTYLLQLELIRFSIFYI